MLEHTKKPHTEDMASICIRVPAKEAEATRDFLRSHGYELAGGEDATYAPEEVLGDITPGRLLRGARHREGMTQQTLADAIGCKRHHISEMENGKRSIGKAMAKRIEAATGVNYKVFL